MSSDIMVTKIKGRGNLVVVDCRTTTGKTWALRHVKNWHRLQRWGTGVVVERAAVEDLCVALNLDDMVEVTYA